MADHKARIAIKSMEIQIAEFAMNQTEGKIIKIEKKLGITLQVDFIYFKTKNTMDIAIIMQTY